MKKRIAIPAVVFLVVSAMFIGTQVNNLISGDNIYDQIRKFSDVLSLAERHYVEEVNSSELVESAIKGMLESLDPHSVYLSVEQLERVEEEFRGAFDGIGIQFQILKDTIHVISPVVGGPSDQLGIMSGDKIINIDGESAVGLTNNDVMRKLRGQRGTKVTVEILRAGYTELLEFEIIRDKIPLHSVTTSLIIDDNVGYIHVNRFASNTYSEFIDALEKLEDSGMEKLVLDLRTNPGGYLEEAFKMTDLFLPRGSKIVYTRGRSERVNEEYIASMRSRFEEIPLIILINAASASASEIVAGAVQDWDRGLIVGERSFGKGLVQRQFPLRDGSALRLTTARYYTPSGRLIQKPYDAGMDAYRMEIFNRIGEEDIEHDEIEVDTSPPAYQTQGGRVVYGGGGITPDVVVQNPQGTELWTSIVRKNLFRLYNAQYMDRYGQRIREEYGDDLYMFRDRFEITADHLNDFLEYLSEHNVEVKSEYVEQDERFLRSRLKAEIGRTVFGVEGEYISQLEVDEQFQRAISLFPDLKMLISAETYR